MFEHKSIKSNDCNHRHCKLVKRRHVYLTAVMPVTVCTICSVLLYIPAADLRTGTTGTRPPAPFGWVIRNFLILIIQQRYLNIVWKNEMRKASNSWNRHVINSVDVSSLLNECWLPILLYATESLLSRHGSSETRKNVQTQHKNVKGRFTLPYLHYWQSSVSLYVAMWILYVWCLVKYIHTIIAQNVINSCPSCRTLISLVGFWFY